MFSFKRITRKMAFYVGYATNVDVGVVESLGHTTSVI